MIFHKHNSGNEFARIVHRNWTKDEENYYDFLTGLTWYSVEGVKKENPGLVVTYEIREDLDRTLEQLGYWPDIKAPKKKRSWR